MEEEAKGPRFGEVYITDNKHYVQMVKDASM